jgi:hypothetical protein
VGFVSRAVGSNPKWVVLKLVGRDLLMSQGRAGPGFFVLVLVGGEASYVVERIVVVSLDVGLVGDI